MPDGQKIEVYEVQDDPLLSISDVVSPDIRHRISKYLHSCSFWRRQPGAGRLSRGES